MPHLLQPVAERAVHPVADALRGLGFRRLILCPNRALHVFPLHACPLDKVPHLEGNDPDQTEVLNRMLDDAPQRQPRYLADEYEVLYTPSLSILHRCSTRRREGRRLLLVENPTGDLPLAGVEGALARRHYPDHQVLRGHEATRERILSEAAKYQIMQYSGHARFDPEDPLSSALILGDEQRPDSWLPLRTIFAGLQMPQNLLTILSGCESGLLLPDRVDEYISLPSGFLHAGASCVISSLWEVYDFPTMLLIDRLHLEWSAGRSVAAALREAQRWLRQDITSGEQLLKEILPPFLERLGDDRMRRMCRLTAEQYARLYPDRPPFASPARWAAFVVTGWGLPTRTGDQQPAGVPIQQARKRNAQARRGSPRLAYGSGAGRSKATAGAPRAAHRPGAPKGLPRWPRPSISRPTTMKNESSSVGSLACFATWA